MITVLLFARLREAVGKDSVELAWETGSVQLLLSQLTERYPEVGFHNVMVAVDEHYADQGDIIPPGSTVALIPPVSGG